MPPKKRTCKRQQQRVTEIMEIMESAVSGEESTASIQNQEPGEPTKLKRIAKASSAMI
ncbi:hypothetical protein DPMN_104845 [Dreissena polymorpha]|uniref:Uncharacterized protein n=1 Tax=Dreissena polymorpha TaxID=45954 RepID=A0A9D4K0E2_DREPO|nr:hypothetical protein DPMN_104845 [Dreissena polymorpha]